MGERRGLRHHPPSFSLPSSSFPIFLFPSFSRNRTGSHRPTSEERDSKAERDGRRGENLLLGWEFAGFSLALSISMPRPRFLISWVFGSSFPFPLFARLTLRCPHCTVPAHMSKVSRSLLLPPLQAADFVPLRYPSPFPFPSLRRYPRSACLQSVGCSGDETRKRGGWETCLLKGKRER